MGSAFHRSPCLSNCHATFRNMIVPGDSGFYKVCKVLSQQSLDHIFSWLYCCDALNCVTWLGSSAGLDSNVNEVIKKCKRFGISNIVDPGPPQVSQCSAILASTGFPTSTTSSTTTSSQLFTATPLSTAQFENPIAATPTLAAISSSSFSQATLSASPAMSSSATNSILPDPTTAPLSRSSQYPTPQISSVILPTQPLTPQTFWQKLSTNAKIGSILGITLLLLLLLILATLFLRRRHRRHTRSPVDNSHPHSQSSLEAGGELHSPRLSPTPNEDISRGGGVSGKYEVVVIETKGKNSLDSAGIRWPDSVVLTGDAKEMWEWSLGYGHEKSLRKSLGGERREKMFEYEMGVERI